MVVRRFSSLLQSEINVMADTLPHSPEWVASVAFVRSLSCQHAALADQEHSSTLPSLNENDVSAAEKRASLPVLANENCSKTKKKNNRRREKEETRLPSAPLGPNQLGSALFGEASLLSAPLRSNHHTSTEFGEASLPSAPLGLNRHQSVQFGITRSAELVSAERRGVKFTPQPPGMTRGQSAKSLRAMQTGNAPNHPWRKLSSTCMKPAEQGLSPVITSQSGWVPSDLRRSEALCSDPTGGLGRQTRPRSSAGLPAETRGTQLPEFRAVWLLDSSQSRQSERLSICCDPGRSEENTPRHGNHLTEEKTDPDVEEDQSETSAARDGMGKTADRSIRTAWATSQSVVCLSKRKLSPGSIQNPISQRSLKNQRSLGTNEGTKEIVQSEGGNSQDFPGLDEEKTAMINKWISDVSAKTADCTRGL